MPDNPHDLIIPMGWATLRDSITADDVTFYVRRGATDKEAARTLAAYGRRVLHDLLCYSVEANAPLDRIELFFRWAHPTPGGFIPAILTVRDEWVEDDALSDATARLCREYYPRGAVFHSNRWAGYLENAFRHFRDNPEPYQDAWGRLATPALYACIQVLPPETAARDLYQTLRRAVRPEIERSLLGGQTRDEVGGRDETSTGDMAPLESLQIEGRVLREMAEALDQRIDLWRALQALSEAERTVIAWTYAGYNSTEMAEALGISAATVRKRLQRARAKLREFV